jgi:tRNA pseudouridine65 synthase
MIDHAIPRAPGEERVAARTEIWRREAFGRYALVEARLHTGRLHQIRRHLKHISCPLIGDVRYGKGEHNRIFRTDHALHRLALHCTELAVPHPDGTLLAARSPLPPDLTAAVASCRARYAAAPDAAIS